MKKLPQFVKKNLKDLIKYIIYMVIIVITINILHPSTWQLIYILSGSSVVLYIYTKRKELSFKDVLLFLIKTFITLSIIIFSIKWLGAYGIIGFILIIILLVAYRLVKQNAQYFEGIRELETMIFGKPLDKDKWKDGELKKFKWR